MSKPDIQIVDENDNPLRGGSPKEARRDGLFHRTVRISVLDENNRLLVQKRATRMDLYPGRWDNSAAGHVDEGEDYEEAAYRELAEELGITGMKLEDMGKYYSDHTDEFGIMKRFTHSYKLVLREPYPEFKLQKEEVEEVKWMDISEVKKLIKQHPEQVTDGLTQVIDKFF